MNKFHINKQGLASKCLATNGNCPFGGKSGSDNHFDTYEEAQAYVDKMNKTTYGILPNSESNEYLGERMTQLLKVSRDILNNKKLLEKVRIELEKESTKDDSLSDEKYFQKFLEDYGKEAAMNETISFFKSNSHYAASLYSEVYSSDSGNWKDINKIPYEKTFEKWASQNVKTLEDFQNTIFTENRYNNYYNESSFLNRVEEFYEENMSNKINNNGLKKILKNFTEDIFNEEKANEVLNKIESISLEKWKVWH